MNSEHYISSKSHARELLQRRQRKLDEIVKTHLSNASRNESLHRKEASEIRNIPKG